MSETTIKLIVYGALGFVLLLVWILSASRKKNKLIRELKTVIKIIYSIDDSLRDKFMNCNSLNTYVPGRYLPMAFYLEKKGVLDKFLKRSGRITVDTVLNHSTVGRLSRSNTYEQLFDDALENRGEYDLKAYLDIARLDDLFMQHIPKVLLQNALHKIYYLRLNLLEEYHKAASQGVFISFDIDKTPKEMKKTHAFITKVLNEFYKYRNDYVKQDEQYQVDLLIAEIEKK